MSDKAIVAGVRGKIVGTKLVMQTGDWEYDTIAPTFPFKPSEKNIALTRNGRLYVNGEVFTGKPFSVKDQKDYMEDEDRKGFFTACFKSTD
ncbi:hypothetical protein [Herbaspirillum hiltneri]|uniref:hypothetical protein n=1 Tax=Herbaspirillum hiltneri TaxID=341045 RepID=UPI0011874D8A|nr:hypothetical protein [Herbaspirillum hiltneri]